MNIRKLLAMLLACAMLLAALPGAVVAEGEEIEIADAAEEAENALTEGEADASEGDELELFVEADEADVEEAVPELAEEEVIQAASAEATGAEEPVANAGDVTVDESHFPDASFRAWVADKADADKDGVLSKAELAAVKEIELNNDEGIINVTSMKGVEYFTELLTLTVGGGALTALDLSANTKLEDLMCLDLALEKLDLSANTKLECLILDYSALKQLDLTGLSALTSLSLKESKQLTSLNAKDCVNLTYLSLQYCNALASLSMGKCAKLDTLDISGTALKALDLTGFPKLIELDCDGSKLKELDVSGNPELENLYCYYCELTSLDVSKNAALRNLGCWGGSLTKLTLGSHPNLTWLRCEFNQLSKLKLDGCPALEFLYCQYNKLEALDVDRCAKLTALYCQGNALSLLSVWNCEGLADLVQSGDPAVVTDFDYDDKYRGVIDRWGDEEVDHSGLRVDHDLTVYADAPAVTSLWLDRAAMLMYEGDTETLKTTVVPAGPVNGLVTWATSDAFVATVENGAVSAVGTGKAVITVTSVADPTKKATCAVTVQEKVSEKTLKKTGSNGTLKVNKGKQIQLDPAFADNKGWTVKSYKSSNKKIASVDQEGLVEAKKAGTVTITVKTKNNKSATIKVKVSDPTIPNKIKLNQKKAVTAKLGTPLYLKATLSPTTATCKLKWKTSNRRAATVSQNGVVTPVKVGKTVITVSTENGKSDRVTVTVVDPTIPTKVKLNKKGTVTMKVGDTLELVGTMSPSTATGALKWSSSAKKIASVTQDGVVTALKKGTTTITVKTRNGKTAKVKIKVK